MKRFVGMLQFLTRITIIKELPFDEEFHKGIVYFPLVGALQGLILMAVYGLTEYAINPSIAAILAIVAYLCLTGALHLDGLGDTFDGFYSSRPKEAILTIMKDSRIGTNGMAVLFFALLLKINGLQQIASPNIYRSLILMPVFGKLALVLGSYKAKYAREVGLGNIFIGKVQRSDVLIATLVTLLLSIIQIESLLFVPATFLIAFIFKKHSYEKIQGMTGDTLGALAEIVEVCYILFLLIFIKWF